MYLREDRVPNAEIPLPCGNTHHGRSIDWKTISANNISLEKFCYQFSRRVRKDEHVFSSARLPYANLLHHLAPYSNN